MGQPAWDKIPFEKLPDWKKQEILEKAKKTVEELDPLKCDVCGKICKNNQGLLAHKRSHNKLN